MTEANRNGPHFQPQQLQQFVDILPPPGIVKSWLVGTDITLVVFSFSDLIVVSVP